ncbi:MAG: PIN domain-containing protein [Actinomycetota bacterium]
MRTFVDTSALYALLDEDDAQHQSAVNWLSASGRDPALILSTHNYVVVETAALVQRRLGTQATRVLFDAFIPAVSVFFVDELLHRQALSAHLAGGGDVSLVDRTSFELIRQLQIAQAFAFDSHFEREGFRTVP